VRISDYQRAAQETDRNPGTTEHARVIAFLGLVGEAGSLLSEYKKLLRDGGAHVRFRAQVEEELGDLLWYVANIATKFDLELSKIAIRNLVKTKARWAVPEKAPATLDDDDPTQQQLPREFEFTLVPKVVDGREKVVAIDARGIQVGDPLTDNAYADDGYRFHDVIHFAFAAKLGWSPVLRKLLRCKRKHDQRKDEVEDGARAAAIEEALATAIAEYALRHGHLEGAAHVDWDLLRLAKRMTATLEVSVRTEAEWEDAIVTAIKLWKELHDAGGGTIRGNLKTREIVMVKTSPGQAQPRRAEPALRVRPLDSERAP